jgi:hypothetical protein
MDGKYCEKCKTALIKCSECQGNGKKLGGSKCPHCNGTGYHCQMHGGAWKK